MIGKPGTIKREMLKSKIDDLRHERQMDFLGKCLTSLTDGHRLELKVWRTDGFMSFVEYEPDVSKGLVLEGENDG